MKPLERDAGLHWLDGKPLRNGEALLMHPGAHWTAEPIACCYEAERPARPAVLRVDGVGLVIALTPQMRFSRPARQARAR